MRRLPLDDDEFLWRWWQMEITNWLDDFHNYFFLVWEAWVCAGRGNVSLILTISIYIHNIIHILFIYKLLIFFVISCQMRIKLIFLFDSSVDDIIYFHICEFFFVVGLLTWALANKQQTQTDYCINSIEKKKNRNKFVVWLILDIFFFVMWVCPHINKMTINMKSNKWEVVKWWNARRAWKNRNQETISHFV